MEKLKYHISFKALEMEGGFNHMHSYGKPRTEQPAGNWSWCEKCECWVTSKCDHRAFPCKARANNASTRRVAGAV